MFSLFKKEVSVFFYNLTGYIVIIIFLLSNSLFLWIFPGENNVLNNNIAGLDTLFLMSPWVFLFLVPAITMRMFAEEKRTGTIELLHTRPFTDLQLVLAKYLASVVLAMFSLLPTLLYLISIKNLSQTPDSLDVGATIGSYIGLFFLAAIYAAIGIFSSAVTSNQIISFLISVGLSFFLYIGFDSIATLQIWGNWGNVILQLGIFEHYSSMSRGVIDTRDVVYFLGVILLFVLATKTVLESRKW